MAMILAGTSKVSSIKLKCLGIVGLEKKQWCDCYFNNVKDAMAGVWLQGTDPGWKGKG